VLLSRDNTDWALYKEQTLVSHSSGGWKFHIKAQPFGIQWGLHTWQRRTKCHQMVKGSRASEGELPHQPLLEASTSMMKEKRWSLITSWYYHIGSTWILEQTCWNHGRSSRVDSESWIGVPSPGGQGRSEVGERGWLFQEVEMWVKVHRWETHEVMNRQGQMASQENEWV
jgi:hypothetical protein